MSAADQFVVYADMLGFRSLVLEHRTPDADTLSFRRLNARTMLAALERGSPLQRAFTAFHETIDVLVTETNWRGDVTVLVFSDSLFLATSRPDGCLAFCEKFICACAMKGVPVRIGIGWGTFVANDFAFESNPRLKMITTQFLGTGVIHATEAEKSIKGMRIALHPSTFSALADHVGSQDRRLALPNEQICKGASHEWNYLPLQRKLLRGDSREPFDRDIYVHRLQRMRAEAPKEPAIRQHYDATLDAVQRMTRQMQTDWLGAGDRRS